MGVSIAAGSGGQARAGPKDRKNVAVGGVPMPFIGTEPTGTGPQDLSPEGATGRWTSRKYDRS